MNTYGDLLNRLSEYFGKTYNQVQSEDIQKYLTERNYPLAALQNLYDLIIKSESFLPKINKFKDIIDEALRAGSVNINAGLHPQSPLQQLYKTKDWQVENILNNCKRIRNKQSQIGTSKLHSWEISFLVIWERLKDIKPEFQNIAKERMLANGDQELCKSVNLNDIMIDWKPVKIKHEVKGI